MKFSIPCIVFFLSFSLLWNTSAYSQYKYYIDLLPGVAKVLPAPLKIMQAGYEDIEFTARYETRSLRLPPYYSIRGGVFLNERTALEIEFNHLKIFLLNHPPEVTGFSISHGYNQLWFNVLRSSPIVDLRVGIGPVIPHPENTVRGKKLDPLGGFMQTGYYLHGVTTQLAVQKQIDFLKRFFVEAEAKLNYSYTRTLVADGKASVSVIALHFLMGAGLRFGK